MKRKSFGRDAGLTVRLLATTALLGLLYVIFAVVLLNVLNVGLIPMLLIVVGIAVFQYYSSDKLALRASGAKIVTREDAPALHDMVERLCAMSDLPKPRVAIIDTPVPNAFATGRNRSTPPLRHPGAAAGSSPRRSRRCSRMSSHIANRDVLIMTPREPHARRADHRWGLYFGMWGGGMGGGNRNSNGNNQVPSG
jgi:heat shock protein HtpX